MGTTSRNIPVKALYPGAVTGELEEVYELHVEIKTPGIVKSPEMKFLQNEQKILLKSTPIRIELEKKSNFYKIKSERKSNVRSWVDEVVSWCSIMS